MSENSNIEWTGHTFNGWHGCTKISPACDNCYAADIAKRFKTAEWGKGKERKLNSPEYWKKPLAWNRRAQKLGVRYRVFCNSMSDVFDPAAPDEWRFRLFALIALTPDLDWQVLTKHAKSMKAFMQSQRTTIKDFLSDRHDRYFPFDFYTAVGPEKFAEAHQNFQWPLPNLWLGVTAENQSMADLRIPFLLDTPAAVRFLSCEPMLGHVDLSEWLWPFQPCNDCPCPFPFKDRSRYNDCCHDPELLKTKLDWVICGGESGQNARPMHPDWARSLRDQCKDAGVPFFFKQWGAWKTVYDRDHDDPDWKTPPRPKNNKQRYVNLKGGHGFHGERVVFAHRVSKKSAGRQLDGKEYSQFPEAVE